MRTQIWKYAALAIVCVCLPASAFAGTPEQVKAVIATLDREHAEIPGVMMRDMNISLIDGHPAERISLVLYPNPFKTDDSKVFGVTIDAEPGCLYTIVDNTLTGVVVEAKHVCRASRVDDGNEFFELFGGAQGLYDKILAEAVK